MRRLTSAASSGRDGLKGYTGTVHFTGCDIFAGPNGSGKSTRLLLITAGLRGLSRKTGQNAGEYLGPASARPKSAKVRLTWDDGQHMTRDVSAVQGKKAMEADAQADLLVGPHLTRWDLGDFADGNDKGRAELLKGLVSAGGDAWDTARVWRFLDSKKESPGLSEPTDPLVQLQVEHGMANDGDVSGWLVDAQSWAKDQFTEANSDKRQADQAVKELQQQAREAAEAQEGGNLASVRERAAEVDAELRQLAGQIATASQSGKAATDHQAAGERHAKAMGLAEQGLERAEKQATDAASGLEEATARMEALGSAEETRVALTAAETALASATEQANGSKQRLQAARDAYSEQQGTVKALEALQAKAGGSCVSCGAEDPLGLAARIEEAKAMLPRLEARGRLTARAHERDKKAASDAVIAKHSAQVALGTLDTKRETAQANLARAEDRDRMATAELERCRKAAEDADLDVQTWRQEDIPQGVAGDIATLNARQAALQAEQTELRDKGQALARDQGGEQALQQALARRETAETRWRAVKDLQAALVELQAEVARGAYGPITGHANKLLGDAGVPLVVYIEDEGDWGADIEGKGRIHFAALSDGERALVAASMAYAFAVAADSPCPMVILDRLEAIDQDRLEGFLGACQLAVSDGRLSNFVGGLRCDGWGSMPHVDGVECCWLGDDE